MIRQDPEAEVPAFLVPAKDLLGPEAMPSFDGDHDGGDEQGDLPPCPRTLHLPFQTVNIRLRQISTIDSDRLHDQAVFVGTIRSIVKRRFHRKHERQHVLWEIL